MAIDQVAVYEAANMGQLVNVRSTICGNMSPAITEWAASQTARRK
jgi:hypothetical protein